MAKSKSPVTLSTAASTAQACAKADAALAAATVKAGVAFYAAAAAHYAAALDGHTVRVIAEAGGVWNKSEVGIVIPSGEFLATFSGGIDEEGNLLSEEGDALAAVSVVRSALRSVIRVHGVGALEFLLREESDAKRVAALIDLSVRKPAKAKSEKQGEEKVEEEVEEKETTLDSILAGLEPLVNAAADFTATPEQAARLLVLVDALAALAAPAVVPAGVLV